MVLRLNFIILKIMKSIFHIWYFRVSIIKFIESYFLQIQSKYCTHIQSKQLSRPPTIQHNCCVFIAHVFKTLAGLMAVIYCSHHAPVSLPMSLPVWAYMLELNNINAKKVQNSVLSYVETICCNSTIIFKTLTLKWENYFKC